MVKKKGSLSKLDTFDVSTKFKKGCKPKVLLTTSQILILFHVPTGRYSIQISGSGQTILERAEALIVTKSILQNEKYKVK